MHIGTSRTLQEKTDAGGQKKKQTLGEHAQSHESVFIVRRQRVDEHRRRSTRETKKIVAHSSLLELDHDNLCVEYVLLYASGRVYVDTVCDPDCLLR